jgi:hypothetical protein
MCVVKLILSSAYTLYLFTESDTPLPNPNLNNSATKHSALVIAGYDVGNDLWMWPSTFAIVVFAFLSIATSVNFVANPTGFYSQCRTLWLLDLEGTS